ncbi:endonuclease/exonuclease/phosphatase [Apodospora peruviana]|uniref:Endonuclease/exonuclease/phosphatase n=1 Tax=Apodospora peruviana TaxID=516989 RepID=A0AAE0HVF6_9PEZI|nr:endonuclease/exonuclease/phosphatase [Apodospora peruviana]
MSLQSLGASASRLSSLRIITHNIRYAATSLFPNERPWPERAPLVINQLRHETRGIVPTKVPTGTQPFSPSDYQDYFSSAFINLQEVLHTQLIDILAGLNNVPADTDPAKGPTWEHVGVGRDDGKTKGEYSPIIYPVRQFNLLHNETVWLSETPDVPSKGWDADSIRILTVGVFEHRQTLRKVVVANTHLDNAGQRSRVESVSLILKTLKRVHADWAGGDGVFLTGDFNSMPNGEAYLAMKQDGWLKDVHDEVEEVDRYGDIVTFSGFTPTQDPQGRIDFVWVGPTVEDKESPLWKVEGYAVVPNVFEAGVYLSDHRAVVSDFTTG